MAKWGGGLDSAYRRNLLTMKHAIIGIVLLLAAAESAYAVPASVQPEVKVYIPAGGSDVSSILLEEGLKSRLYLAVWSERKGKQTGSVTSTVIAVRCVGQRGKIVQRFTMEDAYSPSLLVRPDFKFRGNSVALVQTQLGAAVAKIEVVSFHQSTIHHLGSIEANYFDFVTIEGMSYLVAHDDVNLFDVPRLYRWNGSSFVDDSNHHPEFYERLATKIRSKEDPEKFAPAVKLRFLQLLLLAGEPTASDAGQNSPDKPTASKPKCKGNPMVVAACYPVHGRATFGAGTPALRIWPVRTKRMFGVTARPIADDADEPICPKNMLVFTTGHEELYGDFEVCPFTLEKKGSMQMVCVESASNLTVK